MSDESIDVKMTVDMSPDEPRTYKWWHVYGMVITINHPVLGEIQDAWCSYIVNVPDPPNVAIKKFPTMRQMHHDLPYLASFDHDPTDAEKKALEPADFGDE